MSEIIEHMYPPPVYLRRLITNVQPYDVVTVVADLKTFIFADNLQDKPDSVPVLRSIEAHLSSFANFIPEVDPDGVVVLSLYDALARDHILKDCQRSRADFGSARSSSSSADPSGLPSVGAFARQFADSIAVVQHILEDIHANANDYNQQERVVKLSLRAKSSLLVYCLTKAPSTTMAAGVPALAKLHAIKHATSKIVAVELLKETGLDSSNLPLHSLLPFRSPFLMAFSMALGSTLQTFSFATTHTSKCASPVTVLIL
jgi:hypothetical protein